MSGSAVVEQVEEAVALLAHACSGLEVDAVEPAALARLHGLLVRGERLAAGARVRLARRIDEAPEATGAAGGVAGWIARQTGSTLSDARRELAVSADLPDHPHLDVALEVGAVSTAQAEAIRGGVVADPDAEAELVGLAASPHADLRELRRRTRQLVAAADPDPDATRARHQRRRALRTWQADDGEWHAHINGPADTGATVMAAIKQASDEAFRAARQEGRRESADAYALDGLVTTLTRPTTKHGRGRERKVIGIVDVAAIAGDQPLEPGDRCELAGVGPVSLSAMRDLMGEATVALLIRRGTVDLAVVHLGRQPTAFQRTAVEARGGRCAIETCGATRNLEIDHVHDWATTRRTLTADLDALCEPHHDGKTKGQIRLIGPPGRRRVIPTDPCGHDPP